MNSIELVNLMLSPQWTSKLLHHTICGAMRINPEGIKTELIYLMLPLLIDDVTRKNIKTNIKSSFFTIFVKNSLKAEDLLEFKSSLLSKNNQVKEYKEFTNRALIYLGNNFNINIGEYIRIETPIRYQNEPASTREYCKAGHYLGIILAKEDYLNVFLKLGITNI